MLKPAILYKEELLKKFSEEIYSNRYFYYSGYAYDFKPPKIEPEDNRYQYAIIDNLGNLIGYLAYWVNGYTDSAYNFGLYSFDEGNIRVIRDTYKELERLVNRYHRVEWRCIAGNHAEHGYDNFCKKHNGIKHIMHDVVKDINGNFVNEYIYEIVKKESKEND